MTHETTSRRSRLNFFLTLLALIVAVGVVGWVIVEATPYVGAISTIFQLAAFAATLPDLLRELTRTDAADTT